MRHGTRPGSSVPRPPPDTAPPAVPFGGERWGDAGGERHVTPTQGGVLQKHMGGGVTSPRPCSAVVVRVFRPRPDDTNRASGEGEDGSDPPFVTAGADRRWGGCYTRCSLWCYTRPTPSGGSLPSVCIPAGRLPGPHAGRTTRANARRDVCPTHPRVSRHRRRQRRVRLDVARRVARRRSRGGARPRSHAERVRRRRRVGRRGARRGRVSGRARFHALVTDLGHPDRRRSWAARPPRDVTTFATADRPPISFLDRLVERLSGPARADRPRPAR